MEDFTSKIAKIEKMVKKLLKEHSEEDIRSSIIVSSIPNLLSIFSITPELSEKKPRKRSSKPKKEKVEGEVKKNVNSWIHFCKEKRPELALESVTGKAAMSRLSTMWKELDEAGKQPYKDMADDDKRRYESEINITKPTSDVSNEEADEEETEEEETEVVEEKPKNKKKGRKPKRK